MEKIKWFVCLLSCVWSVFQAEARSQEEQCRLLRERYTAWVTGAELDYGNPLIRANLEARDEAVAGHLRKMEPAGAMNTVFTDISLPARGEEDVDGSKSINLVYDRLREIAVALTTPASRYYYRKSPQNEASIERVLSGLERMYDFFSPATFGIYYEDLDGDGRILPFRWVDLNNDGVKQTDEVECRRCNWWHMEIGIPRDLLDIVAVLYDFMPAEARSRYLDAVDTFIPSPDWTTGGAEGANGAWATRNVALRAILAGNPDPKDKNTSRYRYSADKLTAAKLKTESLIRLFPMESGYGRSYREGFYEDGSCISHSRHPYNCGYGEGILADNIALIRIFEGSDYAVSDEKKAVISKWIRDGIIPFVCYASAMESVRGRGLARPLQGIGDGMKLLNAIAGYLPMAPEADVPWLKAFVKRQFGYLRRYYGEGDRLQDISGRISPQVAAIAEQVWNDHTVAVDPVPETTRIYPLINRAVHHRSGFIAGVSAHSDRIFNYEGLNTENYYGWHTGDGMLLLYNRDYDHYNDNFWVTVDYHMLAGTTVEERSEMERGNKLGRSPWCGGVALRDGYGCFGQQLQPAEPPTLTANKSYFFLKDLIVCLGSGIGDTNPEKPVYTVVENRKIRTDNANRVTVDGRVLADTLSSEAVRLAAPRWAHLSGNVPESDIGYLFLDGQDVLMRREARTNSWRNVNRYELTIDAQPITRNHLSFWYDHGRMPADERYAYAVCPGVPAEKMPKLARRPSFEIVANRTDVSAVRSGTVWMANFWTAAEAGGVTSDGPASVALERRGKKLSFAASDPTQRSESLTIRISGNCRPVAAHPRVRVSHSGNETLLSVNTRDLFGLPVRMELQYD